MGWFGATSDGKGLPSKYGARKVRQAEKFRKSYGSRTPQNTGCAITAVLMLGAITAVLVALGYGVAFVAGSLI